MQKDDVIYRQAAIDALREEFKRVPTNAIRATQAVENLPSAQPERKTGEWISCKKQLPPTTMICHCTVQEDRLIGTSMRDRYTMDLIYDDILNEWNRLSGMKISSSIRVVAWMQAAEPYGGE